MPAAFTPQAFFLSLDLPNAATLTNNDQAALRVPGFSTHAKNPQRFFAPTG